MKPINSKVITVYTNLDKVNTFPFPIYLTFIPTHMTVKTLNVFDSSLSTVELLLIKSSLTNYDVLAHFLNGSTAYPNYFDTTFKFHNQIINGIYEFQLVKVNNSPPTDIATLDMDIALTLEFNQY